MGPQPQRGSKGFTNRQFYTGIKRKKNKLDCAFFCRASFFSPTTPFRCVIRKLLFFVCVFTGGGAEKIERFCFYEYVCVSIYMCVFWRDVEVNGF